MPVLNAAHPFARGLKSFSTHQRLSRHLGISSGDGYFGNSVFTDLVIRPNKWSALNTYTYGSCDNGINGLGAAANQFLPQRTGTGYWPPAQNNFTMACYAKKVGTTYHNVLLAYGSVVGNLLNNGNFNIWKKVSTTWRNVVTFSTAYPEDITPTVYVMTVSSTDGVAIYRGGVLGGSDSAATYSKSDCALADEVTALFCQKDLANYNTKGSLYWSGFWNRVMTPAEIAALSRDPLALIQPARFKHPGWVATIAASFNPSWAGLSNRFIGEGFVQ